MNSSKCNNGSNSYHYFNEDESLEKNTVSKEEENLLASAYSLLKIFLFLIAFINLIKIANVTQLRMSRLQEIKNSYIYEKDKFIKLTDRLDGLLSYQGEQRFMKDQDQMISRDVMRVIWR